MSWLTPNGVTIPARKLKQELEDSVKEDIGSEQIEEREQGGNRHEERNDAEENTEQPTEHDGPPAEGNSLQFIFV
ncbi:MAG: hypothetical protein P0120_14275 [Nitrospira sp.]|nr:hypothetical protein [Nitrospira sp.]